MCFLEGYEFDLASTDQYWGETLFLRAAHREMFLRESAQTIPSQFGDHRRSPSAMSLPRNNNESRLRNFLVAVCPLLGFM